MQSALNAFTQAKTGGTELHQNYMAGVKSMNIIKNLKNHFKIAGGSLAASTAGITAAHALGLDLLSGLTAGAALATGPLAAGVAIGGFLGGTVIALDGLDNIITEGKKARAQNDNTASRTLFNENAERAHNQNNQYEETDMSLDMAMEPA